MYFYKDELSLLCDTCFPVILEFQVADQERYTSFNRRKDVHVTFGLGMNSIISKH